jgi:hypothetical protein
MEKNIYTKLMEVRVNFHKLELKKSGLNKFAGFKYYELGDFLVPATKLLQEANLCPMISFNNELATMVLINGDNPTEQIEFTSPMRNLEIKGSNAVQSLGGVQTYLTRYLYIQLLNIVEADVFDATSGKEDKNNTKKNIQTNDNKETILSELTEEEIENMYAVGYKAGYTYPKVDNKIRQNFNKEARELTKEEYKRVIDGFTKISNKNKVGA